MTAACPQKLFLERYLVSLQLFRCPKASVQAGFCELPQEYAILLLLDLHKLLCDSSSLCTSLSALLTMLLQLIGLEKGKLPFHLCLIALFPFTSGNCSMRSLYIRKNVETGTDWGSAGSRLSLRNVLGIRLGITCVVSSPHSKACFSPSKRTGVRSLCLEWQNSQQGHIQGDSKADRLRQVLTAVVRPPLPSWKGLFSNTQWAHRWRSFLAGYTWVTLGMQLD